MTENEILTGADMIAFCLADSDDIAMTDLADISLAAVLVRTTEALAPLALHFDPATGAHGFFDIYRIGYTDADVLVTAGLIERPAYCNSPKLTQAGAALFARRA